MLDLGLHITSQHNPSQHLRRPPPPNSSLGRAPSHAPPPSATRRRLAPPDLLRSPQRGDSVHVDFFSPYSEGCRRIRASGRGPDLRSTAAYRLKCRFPRETGRSQRLDASKADEGVSFLVVDRIGDIYRSLPRRADVIVTTVGARHKCQQVFNLGVERIPADFLHVFAQGLDYNTFVDSVVQKDLGDTEEVVLTGVEEEDLVSSDVSTVYRSPSPPSPGVDSLEHDLRFALGPAIFSHVEQEERLYFVQSPDSLPAVSPHHESSSSSTDVSLHFDSTDVPAHAQAATHAPASVDVTKLAEILEDLQSSLTQRIHDSNCEIISKLNSVELGVRGDLLKMQSLLRQSFETACRVLERQSNTHTAQITDLKKGYMGPVGTIFGDLFDIKKTQREQDARLIAMVEQIAAIRNEHLDFQSKIAADILSLSTQVGDIADFLISGVAKKGEMASSSRSTTVRAQTQTLPAQTQTLPPTTGTFEERVSQARRHTIETGQVISIEEAAARVMEADRQESERMDRERRERRQSRSGTYKRRR
ncbi:hypothetical protein F511_05880 [Dorcoceras hygrometricum]|uniref:Uncharacterized protein n=1 Tax=Dorcoceras hygrometricum TaxID=472368 RepID=A0A2Z7B3T8_9LAMI|nr:hypothetical protein F511_05880 [Dorcoceras hygrometricum]